jgi:hypothetical protein
MLLSTEIGVSNPSYSSFDKRALESLSLKEECHLSIQLGLNGFSFCIRNDNQILGLETYDFALSLIEDKLVQISWLKEPYASYDLCLTTKKHVLIPNPIFDINEKENYLSFNHRKTDSLVVLSDHISTLDSQLVYGVSKAEQDLVQTFFPNATLKHLCTQFLPFILSENKNRKDVKMIANLSHNQLQLIVVDQSKFKYYNVFSYKNAHDCIYYILFAFEQLELNPEVVTLELLGNVNKDSELYELAFNYIRHVKFGKSKVLMSPNIEKLSNHQHYTLVHQHLCE